jgi:hypothetical protein
MQRRTAVNTVRDTPAAPPGACCFLLASEGDATPPNLRLPITAMRRLLAVLLLPRNAYQSLAQPFAGSAKGVSLRGAAPTYSL